MHLSPEQLAFVRANAKHIIAKVPGIQPADREEMEQQVILHLLQLVGSYTDHPPAYWARAIHNCVRSILRRERAQKRGGGRRRPLPSEDTLPAEPVPDPLDAESVREVVEHAPEGARQVARLLATGSQNHARRVLNVSRCAIEEMKKELAFELRDFGPVDSPACARPRADCVNEGKELPHTEEP